MHADQNDDDEHCSLDSLHSAGAQSLLNTAINVRLKGRQHMPMVMKEDPEDAALPPQAFIQTQSNVAEAPTLSQDSASHPLPGEHAKNLHHPAGNVLLETFSQATSHSSPESPTGKVLLEASSEASSHPRPAKEVEESGQKTLLEALSGASSLQSPEKPLSSAKELLEVSSNPKEAETAAPPYEPYHISPVAVGSSPAAEEEPAPVEKAEPRAHEPEPKEHEATSQATEEVSKQTEHAKAHQEEEGTSDQSQQLVIGGEGVRALANIRGVLPKNVWVDVLLFLFFMAVVACSLRECILHYHVTREADAHTTERQIVHYDPDKLVHISILLRLFAKGSLCSKGKVWYQVFFHVCLWFVITMVLLSTVKYAERLDDRPIRTLSSTLNRFMPFIFAMYLNVVFGRWWTMRTQGLGSMWQAVDDLGVILASHCPGDHFKEQRGAMLRYGMLSQALIYHTARKDLNLETLVEDGLLAETERHVLQGAVGSMPQTVWVWILDLWKSLHTNGHIEWWVLQEAQDLVVEGRRSVKVALTYVTCQIPFGWVHLMTLMVNITILVLVVKTAVVAAKDIADMRAGAWPCSLDADRGFVCNTDFRDEVALMSQLVQLFIVPFLFLAFLEFTNELSNPYGEDPHDFPRNVYMTGMRNENLGFFHVAGKGEEGGLAKTWNMR